MRILSVFISSFALAVLASCVGKQTDKSGVSQDSSYGHWQVVVTSETDPNALCYAVSSPVHSEGILEGKRTPPYLMATRRQSGKIEISAASGYPYQKGSEVELETRKDIFLLKPSNNVAWAVDDEQDKTMIAALSKPGNVVLRGRNIHGDTMMDTYSTDGFEEAVARVRELCP